MCLLATYTWSHAIDLGNDEEGQTLTGMHPLSRGNGTYDERNRALLSYTYDLPTGHGGRFASGVISRLDHLIGGWKLNRIATYAPGQWKSVTLPADRTHNGSYGIKRSDLVGEPYPAKQSYLQRLNINSFV
jgi:hypothetical protein